MLLVVIFRPGSTAHGGPTGSPGGPGALPSGLADGEVLLAVGDIGNCEGEADDAVANLASRLPGTIALLGDIAYEDGSARDYQACFAPAWSPMRDRLHPAPGNHEYQSRDAAPYFEFFGAAAGTPGDGWYSYDVGTWHVVSLNSNCGDVDCGEGSAQLDWLVADLADHSTECTLAYWHHPRYSSGRHGSTKAMGPIWQALSDAGADVVLSGHDHTYERVLADGMREFVVGTGGKSHYPFKKDPLPQTEVRSDSSYGLLWLDLHAGSYEWKFLPVEGGGFTDSGADDCH